MGNDHLNTTEVNADLAALLEQATPGPWELTGMHIHSRLGNIGKAWRIWNLEVESTDANAALIALAPDLAADKLRLTALVADLTAEARETALQYLSDTGQMSERIDELVAANAALAADNVRLGKRVEDAHEVLNFYAAENSYETQYEPLHCGCCTDIFEPINDDRGQRARAWLAGGKS